MCQPPYNTKFEGNSYWQEAITLVKQENLQSCQWRWQHTQTSQGAQITPKQKDAFKISFNANGGLYIQTDCNTGSSTYTIIDQRIDIHPIATTLRYCPDTERLFCNLFNTPRYFRH